MKFLVVSVLLSAALLVAASPFSEERNDVKWANFKIQHEKEYSPEEEAVRKARFLKVDREIKLHNENPKNTYKKAHNHLSDLSREEKKQLLGVKLPQSAPRTIGNKIEMPLGREAPSSLDLTKTTSCVGPVKDQGQCGSCWTFSAITPLEYSHCMKNNQNFVSLSEQQLVDCASNAGNGCDGGWPAASWDYIQSAGGSSSADSYSYQGVQGQCAFDPNNVVAKVASQSAVASDVNSIVNALNEYGPLSVCVQVNNDFFGYSSGVFTDPSCTCDDSDCPINHAVVNVGYGTDSDSGMDYWIIRNSWSAGWGNQGYMWIQKGTKMCGIENYVYAVSAQ